jgi:hypothetical protein
LGASQFAAFADRIGDLTGFAQPNTYATAFVAYDHQGTEVEPPPAFHDFGGTVDENDFFHEFPLAAFA